MANEPEMLVVTQADRDAAERHYPKHLWRQEARDDLVIALAQHRTEAEARIVAQFRETLLAVKERAGLARVFHGADDATDRALAGIIGMINASLAIEKGDHHDQ